MSGFEHQALNPGGAGGTLKVLDLTPLRVGRMAHSQIDPAPRRGIPHIFM